MAEEQSFSRAAERLSLSKSTISKRVARLEAYLNVRLFRRTTRALHLTDAGLRFLKHAHGILEAAREAETEIRATQNEIRGRLRINAPVSLGLKHVSPVVFELQRLHRGLEVELDLSDRRVDLVADGYDVAVRVGELTDSSLVAKKLRSVRFRVVAAPDYLEKRGRPKTPHQLRAHACLLYRYQTSGASWVFRYRGKTIRVRVSGPLLSNHGDVLTAAALDGLGVALLPSFIVEPYIASGALVALFPRSCLVHAPIHALFPPGRRTPRKTRVFVEALEAYFQQVGADW